MFEAQMPSVILKSVAVMKSPTMVFVSTYYPAEIAWVDEITPTKGIDEDWGEGRFSNEHHSMRCITPFNGELYAIVVNNFEFGKLVCTNNIQLEQRARTVNMETLFSFPKLGNDKCGDPGLPIRNTRYAYNSRSHDQCVVNPHIRVDNRITTSFTVPNNGYNWSHDKV
jgi:hypothetical protein